MFFIFFFRSGGPWLITDLDRIESIFVINPNLQVTYNVFLFAWIIVATIIIITYQYTSLVCKFFIKNILLEDRPDLSKTHLKGRSDKKYQ